MNDVYSQSVALHRKHGGKLDIVGVIPVESREDLSLVYTPGVAQVSREIAKNVNQSFDLTWRGRTVAVVSDGSAVLGLGNIGAEAGLPVMEGKALLFKKFGDISAVPLVVDLHTADQLVDFVRAIAPSFGGINLEDIEAPLCFEVEDRLQDIGIPVFHDDQHGTAMVVTAAVRNAAKVVDKPYESLKVVISGAGSAGLAVAQMLLGLDRLAGQLTPYDGAIRVADVILIDSKGIVSLKRNDLSGLKLQFANHTNINQIEGDLSIALRGADVFIGVSKGGLVTAEMVGSMAKDSIVLAMANPEPEIMPDLALSAGAAVVGTGRSDFANQINNSLIFPGFFKGLLAGKSTKITMKLKLAASQALADAIEPSRDAILPSMFEHGLADRIAKVVEDLVITTGLGRI